MASNVGPLGIGIIGAGSISAQYLQNLTLFPDLRVVAIGDLIPEAAARRATEYDVPAFGDVNTVLHHDGVDLVVNLTTPDAHHDVAMRALRAGKHVYNEKPLAADRDAGRELLSTAAAAGLEVGGAPDTFLGPAQQAVLAAVKRGEIGEPKTALCLMQSPGPTYYHPNPEFLYRPGGGPLYDMGPYYLVALHQVFGPVHSVAATQSTARKALHVGARFPRGGTSFEVQVPTHIGVILRYASGASAQLIFSFESALWRALCEVSGTGGTLAMPDPNAFDGDLNVVHQPDPRDETWMTISNTWDTIGSVQSKVSRGIGVLDMARSLRAGTPHRASGALALHVLDVMQAAHEAANGTEYITIESAPPRPDPLPESWDPFERTL